MTIARTPIAFALSLLFVAAAGHAQVTPIADGTSNTLQRDATARLGDATARLGDGSVRLVEPVGASLTTRATVVGNVNQQKESGASGQFSRQSATIGGVRDANSLSGSIATNADLAGTLTQQQRANAVGIQKVNLGGVDGSLEVGNAILNGTSTTSLTQIQSGGSSVGSGSQLQAIDIGGTSGSVKGNILLTNGVVTGPGLIQSQRSSMTQLIRAGSIVDSTVDFAATRGTISAAVRQDSQGSGVSATQAVNVGAVISSQGRSIGTRGTLDGALSQTASHSAEQRVDIGSVNSVDAAGNIFADGTVTGRVTQTAGLTEQRLAVGSVRGGTPVEATAKGLLVGDVTQTGGNDSKSQQTVLVGAIEDALGRVVTDATLLANVTQRVSSTTNVQTLTVGSAVAATGNVNTKAVVDGSIRQEASATNTGQTIHIGSVVRTGANVRTDVTVKGNLTQQASERGAQSILIGGVIGAATEQVGN